MSILLLAALFTISFFYLHFRNAKRPPGPGWIPLLGSLPFLTLKNGILDWVLDENITKYKIATVYILQSRLFVINDFDLAKDLFGRDEFSGKKVSNFLRENRFFKNEPQGIVNTEGSHWMIQRRFSLKTLKDFGFGRQSLEGAINTEIDIVIEEFLSRENSDVLVGNDFNIPIINILWQLVAGYRFDKDNKNVQNVAEIFQDGLKIHFIPMFVLKMCPNLTGYGRRKEIIRQQKEFFTSEIAKHQQSLDMSEPRDFIDVYLTEMKNNSALTVDDLACIMGDFLAAGTETSSTTLKWILLYLTLNPAVQERCRAEIETVLGPGGRCEMSDLQSLPYSLATITEVQRLARVAPMSLIHSLKKTTKVGEFIYPEGSSFVTNLSWITHDPQNFDKPFDFNPDRWLGPDGKYERL